MKTRMLSILVLLVLMIGMVSLSHGATLNLTAIWDPNTETDLAGYKLYRTDGTRTLIGTIAAPTHQYAFTVTVPDQSAGTLKFVCTAFDNHLPIANESLDSNTATFSYNLDTIPPAAPKNLAVALLQLMNKQNALFNGGMTLRLKSVTFDNGETVEVEGG